MRTWMGLLLTERLRVSRWPRQRSPALRGLRFEKLESRRLLDGAAAGEGDPRPDFLLEDANSASPTYQQPVSPRDYLEQVSGWYFASGM
ncbi:MAG TPA: hypothetical protein PLF81_18485 [Candidatus Anammoximicrobium sp.]|nr:hypothetical protein [Candidatus Anammoximicrobium sp.]